MFKTAQIAGQALKIPSQITLPFFIEDENSAKIAHAAYTLESLCHISHGKEKLDKERIIFGMDGISIDLVSGDWLNADSRLRLAFFNNT